MSGDGNKSYNIRSSAKSHWSTVYEQFISGLQLSTMDRSSLKKRGLTDEKISAAGYVSKPASNNPMLLNAIGLCSRVNGSLAGIPGFKWNENRNQWAVMPAEGLIIPVRDLEGSIQSLLIRLEKATDKKKYVAFSTPPNKNPQGGSATNTLHIPLTHSFSSRNEMGTCLRLTEGILKADVASALDNSMLTLGIPGLKAPPQDLQWVLSELEISKIVLAFDQENTADVRSARKKLYDILKTDYEVTFEVWNENHKGIDDALLHDPASIRQLPKEEIDDYLGRIESPAKNWVYVIGMEEFYCTAYDDHLSRSQFMAKMRLEEMATINQMIAGTQGFDPFPQCDDVEFFPGQPQFFEHSSKTYLNLWKPHPVDPSPGDVGLFLRHMEHLIPDKQERNTALQWMAYQRQNPGDKIHWAFLLQGLPGIGKSFLGLVMGALLGHHNISRPTNQELHEQFTSWELKCSLVVVEEMMALGRQELMNKLKPKITEPTTRIRLMQRAAFDQPNRYNMLLLTNYKDSIKINDDERRYFIVHSDAQPLDFSYYDELFLWANKDESSAALQHWALELDMAGFVAKGHAPKTEARKELISSSLSPLEEFIINGIDERRWPFNVDIVSVGDIKSVRQGIPAEFQRAHERKWAEAMESAGAVPLRPMRGQIEFKDGRKRRLWVLRRKEIWRDHDMSLQRIQEEYDRWSQNKQPGGNPIEDADPMQA